MALLGLKAGDAMICTYIDIGPNIAMRTDRFITRKAKVETEKVSAMLQ